MTALANLKAGFRQRGFTLVELAIALAVVGLLLGASLIPLRALDEIRQLQDEQRRLETVRDAVVGYALRHRTRARTLKIIFEDYVGPLTVGEIRFARAESEIRLPAGRPYLPCPDFDGDGFEDRVGAGADGFVQGIEVRPPDMAVTQTIYYGLNDDPPLFLTRWDNSRLGLKFNPELRANRFYGGCAAVKGAVPWRTLGVAPTDGWGNRHTYYADIAFSNAMFGFDLQTVADAYHPYFPTDLRLFRRRTPIGRAEAIPTPVGFSPLGRNNCPAIICDARSPDCIRHTRRGVDSFIRRPCGHIPPSDKLILKAGAVAREDITAEVRGFLQDEVTDGLPFVLVSHGPNGNFAVNHWRSLATPADQYGKGPSCNHDGREREVIPSDSLATPNLELILDLGRDGEALLHEALNAISSSSTHRCSRILWRDQGGVRSFNSSIFVWEPPGHSERGVFDDLLLWMTREELSLAIRDDIPRLPLLLLPYTGCPAVETNPLASCLQ